MEPSGFGDDFGQRVDLCVRIQEIIRAYPEGTAVLKELVGDQSRLQRSTHTKVTLFGQRVNLCVRSVHPVNQYAFLCFCYRYRMPMTHKLAASSFAWI